MTNEDSPNTVNENTLKRIGFLSDVGKKRPVDEDSILTLEFNTVFESNINKQNLLVLADGMGGHSKGEIASKIATNTIAEKMTSHIISGDDYANAIKQAILEANKQILEYTIKNPDSEGMGTTVVCALVDKNNVYLASVGDSRAYVISGEEIRQVTKDHSRVQELIDAGQIKAEEAVSHPQKNVITLAVGIYSDIEVDTMKLTLADDEFLLLCCDGLTNEVNDDDIMQIVTELKEPQSACKKLVDLANDHGGKDNISVIIFG